MTTLHEAARRVVTAWVSTRPAWVQECNSAVLALDAALKAEPAQEPVAWRWKIGNSCWQFEDSAVLTTRNDAIIEPLYTAPPQHPEPAQGPYCYVYEYDGVFGLHREFYPKPYNGKQPDRAIPLYTAPQPQRKPLTDEEIYEEWRKLDGEAGPLFQRVLRKFARAVERKVRGE